MPNILNKGDWTSKSSGNRPRPLIKLTYVSSGMLSKVTGEVFRVKAKLEIIAAEYSLSVAFMDSSRTVTAAMLDLLLLVLDLFKHMKISRE